MLFRSVKDLPATQTLVLSPGRDHPLKEGIATHSSILAWGIPWTEEPDGLPSIELQRVGHAQSDLACMQAQVMYILESLRGTGLENR